MKALKWAVFVVSAVVAILAVAVAIAFLPSVQTWVVRKAVANQPGITIEVGRVEAGLSSAKVSGLRVVQDGVVITVDQVSAEYSAWDYIRHKRVDVDFASVQGLLVDLRHPVTSSAPPAENPFNGALEVARLPVDLRLAKFSVEGKALLPMDRSATFALQGEDIEIGKRGTVTWTVDFADQSEAAALNSAEVRGTALLNITADRRIDSVSVEIDASPRGPNLPPESFRLQLKAEQPVAAGNELYTMSGGLVREQKFEPLFASRIEYEASARILAGTWNVTVAKNQVALFLAGLGLPEIAANGSGKFTFSPSANTLASSGAIQADVSALEKLSPALAAVGSMHLHADFDANLAGDNARLDRLALTATDAAGRRIAEIATLQTVSFNTSTQLVALTDPHAQLARISVQALPLAWAQSVADPLTIDSGDLSMVITVETNAEGSRILVNSLEPATLRNLTVRNGAEILVEQASISVPLRIEYSAETLSADLAGLKLSLIAGDSIEGTISAKVTNFPAAPVVAFTTQLQGKLVAVLKPYLPLDPGPLSFVTAAEGRLEGQKLRIANASTQVERTGGALLVSFDTTQVFDVDLATLAIALPNPNASAVHVRLGEIPLTWGEAFVANAKFAGSLTGGAFDLVLRSLDDLSITSTAPLAIRGLSATIDGQALAESLDITADFSVTKRGDRVGYDVRRLALMQGSVPIATIVVAGDTNLAEPMTVSARGNLEADVAAASQQPVLAPYATLSKGSVAVNFDANSGQTVQARALLKLNNLVARQNNQVLGSLEATLDANVTADGSGNVKLPLVLTAGNRRSDLTLEGNVTRGVSAVSFEGKLTSDQLFVEDFQALAALAPSSPAAPAPAAPKTPAPTNRPVVSTPPVAKDTVPFWQGVVGKFDVDLRKVQLGADYPVSGIQSRIVITETRLGIDTLEGKLKETPFKLAAGITFTGEQAKPYDLTGSATVTRFDIGEFLRAAYPNEKPQLESKVTMVGKFHGNGINLGDLFEHANGEFDVAGSEGMLRALGNKGRIASGASALIGILGAAKGSNTTAALAQLTGELNEMSFDRFTLRIERGADLHLNLKALEFISASKRVTGVGQIQHRPGVPILDQPLRIEVQLAGKEHMARLFNAVGLLSVLQTETGNVAKSDEIGYALIRTKFLITGTAAKPDSSQIWNFIKAEAAKAAIEGLSR